MKTSELEFQLPKKMIAQKPAEPRDSAKLLIVGKKGELKEAVFSELPKFLKKGDLLVFNETKVFPARLFGKKDSGGKLEVLFLSETRPFLWEVLIKGKVKKGEKITFPNNFSAVIAEKKEGSVFLKVDKAKMELFDYLKENGKVPLPPYLKREAKKSDFKDYQTVFARRVGSAAAPTASLHFTESLLKSLEKKGIEAAFITLHVGLGTFAPINTAEVEDHPIHSEIFEVSVNAAEKIKKAKTEGRRVIAVGTTVARTLETLGKNLSAQKGETNIFIYPGFEFMVIDGLLTNFHTPKSSLLALVFAFLGKEKTLKAYRYAIKNHYRFFSYGDGMLIL